MKRKLFVIVTALSLSVVFFGSAAHQPESAPVDYVNILMGTLSEFSLSNGNTYPAIAVPWGMNFWTPQTRKIGDGWQYVYTDYKINGFKQTHQPSPWNNDYGQFSIFPMTDTMEFDQEKRSSWYSHKAEVAKPYYYSVYLADYDIEAEVTPTERAAIFRFTFPETDKAFVLVDAFDRGSGVEILPEKNAIIGYTTRNSGGVPENFKNYFVVVFDKLFQYKQVVKDGKIQRQGNKAEADHTGAFIGFTTQKGEKVIARVASSFISYEQAWQNLREVTGKDFETVKQEGRDAWNEVLGKIEIEGGDLDQQRTFYSTLYRSTLFPRKFHEIDAQGNIMHYSPYNGKILPGYMYTDTGVWDTFRALFPLLNLVYPSVNVEIQQAWVNTYKESGFLPEWASPGHRQSMIGNNSASVVVDAYLKGLRGYDIETLYEALLHGTENVHPKITATGRYGHEYYNTLGYVPYDVGIHENAARTLEYAYADWTIYKLAKELNRPQEEIDRFAKRSQNYRNLYSPEYKLMRGRNKDGSFQSPFSPLKWGDAFTEGNSWHYTWSVFHDPQGLIDLMGGKKEFVNMLDSVFVIPPIFDDSYYGFPIHEIREMQVMNMGQYAHGNQPIQHMLYLYNYAGEPWKGQYWIREVLDKLYSPNPDGYCGDEDNGQTSAWYVFSSLGFYPVCPGTDQYVIGSPLFKKMTVHLENGKTIEINAPDNTCETRYVSDIKMNGKEYTKNYFTHDQLMNGAKIDFSMSETPNKMRGTKESDFPYSFSNEK
ncbi:GH92 family glycosyl hydrolase [Proteiniphilum sp.]|uniref:GH92 family glycosyl hydrolase n=1 Tax=Proteiniphilum sp. TaxID=1926877 RepID=UPI00331693DB